MILVFKVDSFTTIEATGAYRSSFFEAAPLERELIYHDDPVDVAANLAGIPYNQVTDKQLRYYDQIRIASYRQQRAYSSVG